MSAAPYPYLGSKNRLSPLIVSLMPTHRVYLEPFFGSGAVFFAKAPARVEIINDLDQYVTRFLRVLRDDPDELARVVALTPHARAEFTAAVLNDPLLSDLEGARRFWVRVNQSFAKVHNDRTGWSLTTARTQSVPASIAARATRLARCAARLMAASIECCDAVDLIGRMATAETVIYADPPYLGDTRAHASATSGDYRCDMASPADHERLAEALHATPAVVLLSGYPSALYERLYAHWDRLEIPVTVHSGQAHQQRRSPRIEVIWSNRPLRAQQSLPLATPTTTTGATA